MRLEPIAPDVAAITERIGSARFVLIGEASHGTHEFYALRAAVTRSLIERGDMKAICIEGDWPDARRVDRFVRGTGSDTTADQALGGFRRFPQWMWRNTVVRDFVTWLRQWNLERPPEQRCGFYGLDLYSLHASIHEVLEYLERVDPAALPEARQRYGCIENVGGDDPQAYGYQATRGGTLQCEDDVVKQLAALRHCADDYEQRGGALGADDFFSAEQNAQLVADAERYYRSMFRGRSSSWNLRDLHMTDTLDAVADHVGLSRGGRLCVWAHNSHLGDARATRMGKGGELNVGQLVRQRHPKQSCLVGFSTHTGSVTAARDWGDPAERRRVRPSLEGSVERLLHDHGPPNALYDLRETVNRDALSAPMLERAIGVIYRPETERASHYFQATLASQFDLLIHLDETRALTPLESNGAWDLGEPPETFPSGL
ncbi:MAG: erythromycin esterase family protein [Gemmatimonadaceae bacterium]|nr:erythromycin esterase family protein [Gemmatimonadaceae bacterium]